ncbi:MAG: DUF4956 domain-containing protein [Collinsella sp.]|nr:DUF4956 domain-containing protein [Collinsella sp.]MEE0377106.1 DUF4956 domain-containing protein [Collinsella sp.]MEE0798503.1 DUF4956 domain-containing protein [Collinsella sp.]
MWVWSGRPCQDWSVDVRGARHGHPDLLCVQALLYRRRVLAQLCRDTRGMCVLTCMVTFAISTNVVISLGMVGALSIVRYRTAVKDPLDLLYLFWAITTGITAGAGMYALVGLTAVVIVVMIAGFASHQDKARVYMMVIHYTGQTTGDDIVRAFGRTKFTAKSKTMRGDKVEMAAEVFSDGVDMPYADAIRALDGVEDLTLIQYNGEYHG